MNKTEYERQLHIELEVAARNLWEVADEMCHAIEDVVEIAADGDANPEICHQIDDRIHTLIQQHSLLLCLSHAAQAVRESNSLANQA